MEKKLQRNQQDKMIAGVCSGLADYFDIDATWVRIAFVFAVIAGGSGILAYLILWIVVPKRPYMPDFGRNDAGNRIYESNTSQAFVNPKKKGNSNLRLIAGVVFIFFGVVYLLNELDILPDWYAIENLWPVILIAMGVYILSAGFNTNNVDAAKPEESISLDKERASTEQSANIKEQINPNTDDVTDKPL